ncbi:MAG: single-stranded DNA-binding protein [Candidatus Krumholzibacteriota bacterium]|nr:single-stranded DNA-binding protein [Candidatus Krumholzibacteriota bacterium]
MAAGVNKVILVGNLGQDPELRYAQSGTAVANARLATTERRKNQEGEWGDHTEWHRLVFFGKTAETLARYCKKGRQIYVEGSLQTRSWEGQDGQKRWSTEVRVNQMIMLGGRGDSAGGGEWSQDRGDEDFNQDRGGERAEKAAGAAAGVEGQPDTYQQDDDDDLPF